MISGNEFIILNLYIVYNPYSLYGAHIKVYSGILYQVIGVEFSEDDDELVEIVEAVAEVATEMNNNHLTREEKKAKRFYIDTLVARYFGIHKDSSGVLPARSLFAEGINWYVSENFRNPTLSSVIKSLMRELLLQSYDRRREQYYAH